MAKSLTLAVSAALLLSYSAFAEPRMWTSASGSKISAELQSFDGKTVTLRSGSRILNVAVTQLSPDDQLFLKAQQAATAAQPASKTEPPAPRKWPDVVEAPRSYKIIVVDKKAESDPFVYRSPHYEFSAPIELAPSVIQELAVVFEATYALLEQLPIDLNLRKTQTAPLNVRLVEEVSEVIELGGIGGSAYYLTGVDALVSTLENLGAERVNNRWSFSARDVDFSNTTLRIAQQLYSPIRGPMPTWFDMGFGKYVEIMRYKDGRFFVSSQRGAVVDFGKERDSSTDFPMTDLKTTMEMTSTQWNALIAAEQLGNVYPTCVLHTYYLLHLDGAVDSAFVAQYIQALSAKMPEREAKERFLMRGRSYEELATDVESKLRADAIRVKKAA